MTGWNILILQKDSAWKRDFPTTLELARGKTITLFVFITMDWLSHRWNVLIREGVIKKICLNGMIRITGLPPPLESLHKSIFTPSLLGLIWIKENHTISVLGKGFLTISELEKEHPITLELAKGDWQTWRDFIWRVCPTTLAWEDKKIPVGEHEMPCLCPAL